MNLREQNGFEISKTKVIMSGVDGWIVPSQSSNKKYFVRKDFSCSCPDHKERGCQCKHAFAEAQNCEVNQFEVLLKDLLEDIEEPVYSFGRPKLSRKEVLFCAIQKVYSQLSSRRAFSLFKNVETKNIINKTPNYNAINKILNEKEITSILKDLVVLSASPLKVIETSFSVDSSGFRTTRFNEYCKEKHDTKKEHNWLKAHICSGNKTNIVCSAEITNENGADCPQFKPLVETVVNNGFNVQELMADKAYSSRENFALIDSLNAVPFIPFKSNTTSKPRGQSRIWRKMFYYFKFNQDEFMQHYHARSNIESTFNMIKSKFNDLLKSKTLTAQKNELLLKVLCHNIVVVIHETNELGINANFN